MIRAHMQPALFDLGPPAARMLWHYTHRQAMPHIVRSGMLRPDGGKGQTKLVWFSAQQLVEPTASACWASDLKPAVVYRLGIRRGTCGVVRWDKLVPIMSTEGMLLAGSGVAMRANPNLWFASAAPVPLDAIHAFEGWDGARWLPLTRWELLPLPRKRKAR